MNPLIKAIKSIEMKGALRTLAGGTASRLGGGKFASGATSAAMGFLFNEVLHGDRDGRSAAQKGCLGQMCRNADSLSMQERQNAINGKWIAENIPDSSNITSADLANAGFGAPEPANRAKFHNNWFGFEGNRKYVHPDGYEIVLDVNNSLVTHPAAMGTYNYGGNDVSHFFLGNL